MCANPKGPDRGDVVIEQHGDQAHRSLSQISGRVRRICELPGANTQGATLEEARENLKEAVAMVLQANRELVRD